MNNKLSSFGGKRHQRGATLIVILFLLLIITVIGTYAIRQAILSLGISTNAQVNQLLSQAADTPLNYFANVNKVADLRSYDSVVGAAIKAAESLDSPHKEIVFCYKPTSNQLMGKTVNSSTIKVVDGSDTAQLDRTNSGVVGFCDISKDFGSARQGVVTQVAVSVLKSKDSAQEPGASLGRGSDLSGGLSNPTNSSAKVRITTTAFLPAYANTSLANVQSACLSSGKIYISDNLSDELKDKKTLVDCLEEFNIPVVSQAQDFNLMVETRAVEAP